MEKSLQEMALGSSADAMARLEASLSAAEEALKWYSERAADVVRYLALSQTDAILAVLKEFELDGGRRAAQALSTPPLFRCTACEAESEGDPPDCPRDGVHCNVVEAG